MSDKPILFSSQCRLANDFTAEHAQCHFLLIHPRTSSCGKAKLSQTKFVLDLVMRWTHRARWCSSQQNPAERPGAEQTAPKPPEPHTCVILTVYRKMGASDQYRFKHSVPWRGDQKSRLIVMRRDTGATEAVLETDAFFHTHQVESRAAHVVNHVVMRSLAGSFPIHSALVLDSSSWPGQRQTFLSLKFGIS